MNTRKDLDSLIKELAALINSKIDIPLINEETEQLFFELILKLLFQLMLKKKLPNLA